MSTALTRLKLRYFGWVRERLGRSEEEIAVPQDANSITDLVAWLSSTAPEYEVLTLNVVRVAVDRSHALRNASINGAAEVAFFPPVTGG